MNSFSLIYNNYNKHYDLISDCPNIEDRTNFIANNSQIINIEDINSTFLISELICSDSSNVFSFSDYTSSESSILVWNQSPSQEVSVSSGLNYSFINESLPNKNKINSNIKEFLNNNITQLLNKKEIGKIYDIKGEDFNLIIKPTNFYYENSTQINFIQCENILRKELNISSSRILTLLQIEIYNKDSNSLINKVEYQVYDDNKNSLDLSKCDKTNIQINYLIKNNNTLNYSSISYYKDIGVDILNINDSFFNDICRPFSDSKNDLVLEDRIKDIYQNYSLCEEGCTYNEINLENKTISCDCNIKNNISLNESILNIKQFSEINIESNFGIIKCYKLVFSLNGKLKNIGFWIFSIFILIHIPLLFSYFYKEIKAINEYIINEMIKSGYLKKGNKSINKKHIKKINKIITLKKNSLNSPQNQKINKDEDKYKNLKSNDISSIKNPIQLEKGKIIKHKTIKNTKNKSKNGKNIKRNKIYNNKSLENSQKYIYTIQTQNIEKTKNENNTKGNNIINYDLINNNLNNINNDNITPNNSENILTNYSFEEAIKYDLRSICKIFYIFLLSKQAIFHTFLFKTPLESFSLRLCLLIFIISSDLSLNAILYLDDIISKKYKYVKNLFLFTFNNNFTIILLSTLIGFIFMTFFTNLNNSINSIRNIFHEEEKKMKDNKKYKVTEERKKEILNEIEKILKKHKIKVIILIIIEVSLIIFFWYYVTAFCHVYSRTQISWLLDSFLSIISRFIIECLFSLLFAKLYRIAIESSVHCLYKLVLFFYCFG